MTTKRCDATSFLIEGRYRILPGVQLAARARAARLRAAADRRPADGLGRAGAARTRSAPAIRLSATSRSKRRGSGTCATAGACAHDTLWARPDRLLVLMRMPRRSCLASSPRPSLLAASARACRWRRTRRRKRAARSADASTSGAWRGRGAPARSRRTGQRRRRAACPTCGAASSISKRRRAAPSKSASPGARVMDQRNETFVPHVLGVTAGTVVDFPNSDRTFHNVFSLSRAKRFDLGRYAAGRSKSVRFDRPGVVRVFCDIHSHMNAFVLVFSHPFFDVTDADGRFRIDNVPAGTYTVVGWYEGEARTSRAGDGAARRRRRSRAGGPVMACSSSLTNRIFLASTLLATVSIGFARVFRERPAAQRGRGRAAARSARGGDAGRPAARDAVRDVHAHRPSDRRPAEVQGGASRPSDAPTIEPIARDYQQQAGSDLFLVTDPDGHALAAVGGCRSRSSRVDRRARRSRAPATGRRRDGLLAAPERRAAGRERAGHHRPRAAGAARHADDRLSARRRTRRVVQGADRRRRRVRHRRTGARRRRSDRTRTRGWRRCSARSWCRAR